MCRYFQDAEAALIVYDVTFRPSFEAAKRWVEDLRANSNVAELTLAIVGNKSDQMGEAYAVQLQEAHEFAALCKAEIVKETSARDNQGIQELFTLIAAKLIKKAKAKQVSGKREDLLKEAILFSSLRWGWAHGLEYLINLYRKYGRVRVVGAHLPT